jgi:hypothetical protein
MDSREAANTIYKVMFYWTGTLTHDLPHSSNDVSSDEK